MNVVSIKKNSKTARNSINHTQPLPPYIVMVLTKHIANIKLSLLVKTSENFTFGNAFPIKLPTPQEELQGKWQEYALGGGRNYLTMEHFIK